MTENQLTRRLAAVFATDVVGYSRMMGIDEAGTLQRMTAHIEGVFKPAIKDHSGQIVKTTGDGLLVEFSSAVDAVECAVFIQKQMADNGKDEPEDLRVIFRIGINLGDIIIQDGDIFGEGVNIAARLEGLADPGGICISADVHTQVHNRMDAAFEDRGVQQVKNISQPIRVYAINSGVVPASASSPQVKPNQHAEKASIAVLAFNNMSGDPEQEYFSDGISEDIITGLACIKDLVVIARNSSFVYKGEQVDVKSVGAELGVKYILEGSVRKGGDRVRVTGQLIDTETGAHVWADKYDGTLDDIFELQDKITAEVLSAVGTEITLAEITRARRDRPESLDAWDLYLQALHLFYQTDKVSYEAAKELLYRAIEIEPGFSSTHALLAMSFAMAGYHAWDVSASSSISMAKESAATAIFIDRNDAFAHAALGWAHMLSGDQVQSAKSFERALQINPNLSAAYGVYVSALAFLGRTEEAFVAAEKASSGSLRDPERYQWYIGVMNACFASEQLEESIAAAENAIQLQPKWYGGYIVVAAAASELGLTEKAANAAQAAHRLNPRLNMRSAARNPLFTREKDIQRLLDGLRNAGLPE